jgi:hypothetical protein
MIALRCGPAGLTFGSRSPSGQMMTSQGSAHRLFQRAINRRHVLAAEMAAREMGGLSPAEALSLCELLAKADPARYECAASRWLERFIEERLPPVAEIALAASALAELRHGQRNVGVSGSGVRTGAPAHANSICAYNGLNDMNPAQGQIASFLQTPHNQGSPGDAGHGTCAGGTNPENP